MALPSACIRLSCNTSSLGATSGEYFLKMLFYVCVCVSVSRVHVLRYTLNKVDENFLDGNSEKLSAVGESFLLLA